MACLFGHKWDGCKCTKCGKTRDEGHDWDGCKCTKCGKTRDEQHRFKVGASPCVSECEICGKRIEKHDVKNGKCKNCSEAFVSWDNFSPYERKLMIMGVASEAMIGREAKREQYAKERDRLLSNTEYAPRDVLIGLIHGALSGYQMNLEFGSSERQAVDALRKKLEAMFS